MDKYNENFKTTLKKFVVEIDELIDSDNIKKILKVYKKLKFDKVQQKYMKNVGPYIKQINDKDESMFSNKVILLPGINLKNVWKKINNSSKERFWVYLKMLYILSEICVKDQSDKLTTTKTFTNTNTYPSVVTSESTFTSDTKDMTTVHSNTPEETPDEVKELEFNPYVGINANLKNKNYNVSDIISGAPEFEVPDAKPSLESLMKTMGSDKLKELDKLTDQLKNMKKSDIDNATKNIKSMMGADTNEATSKTLDTLLTNIASSLNKTDMKKGNLFETLSTVAESVANDMKPKIDSGEINVNDLWKTTNSIFKQCSGGNSMMNPMMNPMNFFSQMIKKEKKSDKEKN